MRRATITIPDDLEGELESYLERQEVRPSLASLAQTAIRQFVRGTDGSGLLESVLRHRSEIRAVAEAHGATSISLFGSVARGEARSSSDLDFVVDVRQGTSLFDLARLRAALIDLLGTDVDVVPVNGLDDEIRARLDTEAIHL